MTGKTLLGNLSGAPFAVMCTEDFLRLNESGDIWKALSEEIKAGLIQPEAPLNKWAQLSPEEDAELERLGFSEFEIPEEVAEDIKAKASELKIGVGTLLAIIIRYREARSTLCIRDIKRGYELAAGEEIEIDLPPEVKRNLIETAERIGIEPEALALRLVEKAIAKDTAQDKR